MIVTVRGRRIDLTVLLSRALTLAAAFSVSGDMVGLLHLPSAFVAGCTTLVAIYNMCVRSGLLPSGLVRPVESDRSSK